MGGCFGLARVDHDEDRRKKACIFELNASFKEICRLLREVTGDLRFIHDDDVIILNLKRDISSNSDLLLFIQEYFKNTVETLKLFVAIKQCCCRAHEDESIVNSAMQFFNKKDFAKSFVKLKDLTALRDPCTSGFLNELRSMCQHQRSTLFSLNCKKHEIKQKVHRMKAWRKVWIMVGTVTVTAALISSLVLAAMMLSPVATAIMTVFLAAIEPIRRLCNPLWKKWRAVLKEEYNAIEIVKDKMCLAICDLDEIKVAMEQLEATVGLMALEPEFRPRSKEKVVDLEGEVDKCIGRVKEASTAILQVITDQTLDQFTY